MPSCAIKNCKNNWRNTKGTGVRYFSFPKEKEMREKWKVIFTCNNYLVISNDPLIYVILFDNIYLNVLIFKCNITSPKGAVSLSGK